MWGVRRMIFNSSKRTIVLLIILCILIRVVFVFTYKVLTYDKPPSIHSDTSDYMRMASNIASFDFSRYDGTRTPVYPLFILLCHGRPMTIFIFQMAMGVAISMILFLVFRTLSHSNVLGFGVGMVHSLNLTQLLFEASILTETITTFFVSLTVLLMFKVLQKKSHESPSYFLILSLGLFSSLSALTRPLCLILIGIVLLFLIGYLIHFWSVKRKEFLIGLMTYLLPCCLLLGGWSYFNYTTIGSFSISTLLGLNLTHWSGKYIESAPAEYSEIKDIYIKYRNSRGSSRQTIWYALPELTEKTGFTVPQLSKVFKKMSFEIIIHNPKEYMENVFRCWIKFWVPTFYYQDRYINKPLIAVTRVAMVCFTFIFLLAPIIWMVSNRFRNVFYKQYECYFVYSIVIGMSVIQAFLISVENSRYSIIIDSLVILMVFYIVSLSYRLFAIKPESV
jgi:hypothetical protein